MLFRRRQKLTLTQKFRELVFPAKGMEQGWDRRIAYYRHRLFRNADSAHKVTAGLALGIAISFTPFLGLHIFIVMFLCWLFRINVFAGVLGTIAGTPWTFPLMYWLAYEVGAFLFHYFGIGEIIAMPETLTVSYLFHNPLKLFLPLTVGGVICAILSWPLAYLVCYVPVQKFRRRYHEERRQALAERKARTGARPAVIIRPNS